MAQDTSSDIVLAQGKHLQLIRRGKWEFAHRPRITGIVGIVAVTDDGKLLLVEQYRPPLQKNAIELPAGLAGDIAGAEAEALAAAARRELLEETGYEAGSIKEVAEGCASAGITDEIITIFLASKLTKVSAPTGDGGEQITLHEVTLSDAVSFLERRRKDGNTVIDLKVYAGLHFARSGG